MVDIDLWQEWAENPQELAGELKDYLRDDGLFHPLVCIPKIQMQMGPVMFGLRNQKLKTQKKCIEDYLNEDNYLGVIYVHERPYRFSAFEKYIDHMTDKEYWENLGSVYTDSESIYHWEDEIYYWLFEERTHMKK